MTLWYIIHETLVMMGFTFLVGIAFAYLLKLLTLFFNHTNKDELSATIWHLRVRVRAYRMTMNHVYSIYWDKDTNILFACQKTKGEESSQDMGANPIVQKWWDYMADIMEVNADNSPVTIPLPEVFHMD